jgi:hypothetical protein
MPQGSTMECAIGREYAATIAELHRKRDAATDEQAMVTYAQTAAELWRINNRHFKTCAVCQAAEARRLKAAGAGRSR